ncbi:hypothetical protein [Marinobacterium jannaschii]|uniref:hypothetical protein n=1 Tax=Marinobacterium jannaschii TaxID=64970 RepID=UPI000684AE29|nr:hypothetical protein [Marinobacterium jannaschii]
MSTIPAFNSGVQSLYTANQQLNQHAHKIATQGVTTAPTADSADNRNLAPTSATTVSSDASARKPLTESLVGLQQSETYALAGTKVIQTSDEMLGSLIDIQA